MIVSIRDSIIKELRKQFPTYKIYDEKVTQGLKRPCFFVDLIPVVIEKISPTLKEYSMFVDIQFMSKDKTKTENLAMVSKLESLFETISFQDLTVKPGEKRFEIVDDILHCIMDIDFTLIGEIQATVPNMGELVHGNTLNEGGF